MIEYDPHRWIDHLLDIKGSMLRQLSTRLLPCTLWAVVVTVVHHDFVALAISPQAHLLIGLVLGLLLVFRTNASYDRFWEGRKLWGSIINETRNLARVSNVLLADAPDLLRELLGWTMAFPWTALHALRGGRGLGPAAAWLPPAAVETWAKAGHGPLAVARNMTALLDQARRRGLLSDILFAELDRNVQQLIDYIGSCERIHRTPLPFAYVVHLRRVLILYVYTLPLALQEPFGWEAIPATLLLAFALFGVEEIGVEIEDPFGLDDNDLPLEKFCATIERNLRELLPTGPSDADDRPAAEPRQA